MRSLKPWLILGSLPSVLVQAGVPTQAIKSVMCQVCKYGLEEVHGHVTEKKIKEKDPLLDFFEGVCSYAQKHGRWVASYDVIHKGEGQPLILEKKDGVSKCNNECRLLQKACSKSFKGKEEELTSLFLEQMSLDDMKEKICRVPCSKKNLNVKSWTDEIYVQRDPKEVEVDDIQSTMQGSGGMNVKVYSAKDIDNMGSGDLEAIAAAEEAAARRAAEMSAEEGVTDEQQRILSEQLKLSESLHRKEL
eukprot:TRINITY_DN83_c2_g5_i1.p1 TRINITY_DN83_c2_g5~~TRINITY_DN83_c2_g5_i1.p1  ORF type:complete len:247 (+),score=49.23 TRINITY_DN83_c2_g5_i1:73-813(+)